ncbi:hypothetical protein MMC30_008305 [Trapelia coarctata]|nr:hypothetical protein [Trapelia coarctata]
MGDLRRSSRRTSARLADKEDAPSVNGNGYVGEKAKASQANGASARQGKTVASGAGQGSTGAKGKRKHDYDEEDDGFMFTRTRSKRTKATPAVQVPDPVIEEVREDPARPVAAKRTRKRSVEAGAAAPLEKGPKEPTRRRSPRNSGDGNMVEPPPLEVKKKRQKANGATHTKKTSERDLRSAQAEEVPEDKIEMVGGASEPRQHVQDHSKDVTKIALPFADTPIIRRNKEMRKGGGDGSRRSSLGMRGRRASSLIDSGKSNALPHDEVESSEFYKHVESGLPEPRRMRQLLTWCGTRALGEKPSFCSEDSHARLAAREIQQQLLKDFSTKSDMSDWFNREEIAPPPQPPQPNPKNIANLAKIQELEQQIAKLQMERQTWDSLLSPPTTPLLPPLPTTNPPSLSTISSSLLACPTQSAALSALKSFADPSNTSSTSTSTIPLNDTTTASSTSTPPVQTLHQSIQSRLQHLASNIEFQVDTFAENIHVLTQYRTEAEGIADKVTALAARGLEERERRREERGGGVGAREVLRGLSWVLER